MVREEARGLQDCHAVVFDDDCCCSRACLDAGEMRYDYKEGGVQGKWRTRQTQPATVDLLPEQREVRKIQKLLDEKQKGFLKIEKRDSFVIL